MKKQILESKISKYMERNQSPRKLYYTTCLFNGWSEEGYKYFFCYKDDNDKTQIEKAFKTLYELEEFLDRDLGIRIQYQNLSISCKFKGDKNWNCAKESNLDNYNNHRIYIYNTDTQNKTSFEYWNSVTKGEIDSEMELVEAFNCFVNDARNYFEYSNFDKFKSVFGYEDNKRAKIDYNGCKKSYENFKRVIGNGIYQICNDLKENYGL